MVTRSIAVVIILVILGCIGIVVYFGYIKVRTAHCSSCFFPAEHTHDTRRHDLPILFAQSPKGSK
jgi:hypothetical protein